MSIASTPLPTPHELFGPARTLERAKQVHAQAVDAVLAQCRERLRRGVAPASVTVFLRSQYVLRLAPLAAGLEVLADSCHDDPEPCTCAVGDTTTGVVSSCPKHGTIAVNVSPDPSNVLAGRPVRVDAGTVRYAPFGNAAPRRPSRKQARA